ncbi:hypothetical protein GCM10010402_16120 [Actinomadura luteofluorescens]|uniref:hypothetical protein n=1 Tax=Actinomadura luteofluorescens TaxID=46163 RepID=UPI00216463B2|nr:hypothetical protein [Actinomadura glauciflava]MCR3739972.1 hypothetical protein [Actinomadura glauciflava]
MGRFILGKITATAVAAVALASPFSVAASAQAPARSFVYKGQTCEDHSYDRTASYHCWAGPPDSHMYQTHARCSDGSVKHGNYEWYTSVYFSLVACPPGTSVIWSRPEPQYD